MKKFTLLFFIAICLCGCQKSKYADRTSFMVAYRDMSGISVSKSDENGLQVTVQANLNSTDVITTDAYHLIDTGIKKSFFDSLCIKHNDNKRPIERLEYEECPITPCCVSCDFLSIDVVSKQNFDEQHPKGTSLSDIVRFHYITPYPYIMSGYSDFFELANDRKNEYHTKEKLLKDLTLEDLTMVGSGYKKYTLGYLSFDKKPSLVKQHPIKIIFKADNGKEFVAETEILF